MRTAAAAKQVGSPQRDQAAAPPPIDGASHATASEALAQPAAAGGGGAPDAVARPPSPVLRPLETEGPTGAGALAVATAGELGVAAVPATPLSGGPPPGIVAATAPSAARATALGSISGIVEEPELESLELDGSSAAPRSTARRDAIVDVRPARTNKRARDANRFIDPKSMRGRMIAWLKQRLNCAAQHCADAVALPLFSPFPSTAPTPTPTQTSSTRPLSTWPSTMTSLRSTMPSR
jgi:hypothetical protein